MTTTFTIEFRNGDTSIGYYIALYHNDDFIGVVSNMNSYLKYAGIDYNGNKKATHIGLLREYGKMESLKAIYPIETVDKIYQQ